MYYLKVVEAGHLNSVGGNEGVSKARLLLEAFGKDAFIAPLWSQ